MAKKALVLGVPYFVFSTATWILKTVFSGSVNDQIGGLVSTLFLHPTFPYWYLYCLFFVFVITPTFIGGKSAGVALIIALAVKVLVSTWGYSIYTISTVFLNEIWFVMGMCIYAFDLQLKGKKLLEGAGGILF